MKREARRLYRAGMIRTLSKVGIQVQAELLHNQNDIFTKTLSGRPWSFREESFDAFLKMVDQRDDEPR